MNRRYYPERVSTSLTTEDLFVSKNAPKKRPLRPGESVYTVRVNPEQPPPGWRPESLRRDA